MLGICRALASGTILMMPPDSTATKLVHLQQREEGFVERVRRHRRRATAS